MPVINYNGQTFEGHESETILDCLIRNGQSIPNSCRGGVCQSCTLKTISGADSVAQKGLSASRIESGLFLSCQQRLTKDFEVTKSAESNQLTVGEVLTQNRVSLSVVIITISWKLPSFIALASSLTSLGMTTYLALILWPVNPMNRLLNFMLEKFQTVVCLNGFIIRTL